MTTFVVFNKADVPADVLSAMIAGWRCQLAQDVCPALGLAGSTVRSGDLSEEPNLTEDEVGVSVFKNPDVPDAGGYHDEDPQGRAYCRIFTDPYLQNGGSWTDGPNSVSCAGSHEMIEALGDMGANGWWLMPDGRLTAEEECDVVEGDSYVREGVAVSNFLLPNWARAGSKGPFDFMGVLLAPFTLAPGGYWIVSDGSGNVTTEWGAKFPEWKKPLKILHSKRLGQRAKVERVRVWTPESFPLDPVRDRFKPRMLLQEAAKTGIPTIDRAPTHGRSVVNVTGVKPVQTPITKVKVTNNSGQKLGKKVW